MNAVFNNQLPVYKNRREVSSYSRRTRSRNAFAELYDSLINICDICAGAICSFFALFAVRVLFACLTLVGCIAFTITFYVGSVGIMASIAIAAATLGCGALAFRP